MAKLRMLRYQPQSELGCGLIRASRLKRRWLTFLLEERIWVTVKKSAAVGTIATHTTTKFVSLTEQEYEYGNTT